MSSLLALVALFPRGRRGRHVESFVVLVVLEVDLVHGFCHHDGNVVVATLQIQALFIRCSIRESRPSSIHEKQCPHNLDR